MPADNDDRVRSAPDAAFIARMRRSFGVEAEIDHVLNRKLRRRAQGAYSAIPLTRLIDGTRALLRRHINGDFELARPRWLQGGSSKLQMAFDLAWTPPGADRAETTPMVLRMEPAESIVETSRRREFEILKAMAGTVPVPKVYWCDAEGECLPYPALIYGFIDGIARPKERPGQGVRGVGTNFSPELRRALSGQFVDHLAAIHSTQGAAFEKLGHFEPARAGTNTGIVRQVNWWRRVWEEDRPEELPLIDVASRWLVANAPVLDHVSVVHGDYRAGNFLFTEHDQRITAILDWELAVLGDRHQDLTWSTSKPLSRYAEDGETLLATGLLTSDEFFERYQRVSGLSIDPKRLKYFRVFNDFVSTVHMIATAWRVADAAKTHQDVVVAWHSIIGNVIVAQLRATLEEVL